MCNNKGSALIAVLSLAIILNIVFMSLYFAISKTQKRAGSNRVNTVVLAIAEAGKEHAISLFRSGAITPVAGTTINILNNVSFGGGTYSVWYRANAAMDTIYLPTRATYGTSKCSIEVTCLRTACMPPTDEAYNFGLIAGGSITWSGSGNCNTGTSKLHCNNSFTMSGSSNFYCQILSSSVRITMSGSGDINGSINTPALTKSGSGKISGTTSIGPVANVSIPVIDLTPYYNHAYENGQVFSSKSISGSTTITIPGGIMWVNGNFTYSGSGNVNGSIFATGDIKISGSGDFTAASTYPAIVSRDGNIEMSGSGKVSGLIYSRIGTITKSGSGDVTGSMICGGNFTKSGSWNTLTYKNSAPIPPKCAGNTFIEISWKEL